MFEPAALAIPEMTALVPQFSLIIEDLAHLSDEDLKARSLGAFQKLALWLLRDARDPVRLLDSFGAWTDAMLEARRAPGGAKALAALITYMFRVIHPMKRDELRAKFDLLGPNTEESAMAMSIADQLHEEGLKEGINQGLERGRKEGIKRGRKEGIKRGRKEGIKRGRKEGHLAMLRSLLVHKFGPLDPGQEARLRAATHDSLERYGRRVLTSDSLDSVLTD